MVGGAVAFVVVAALISSPLYLNSLSNDAKRLDRLVADPIDEVRRVIFNLDESLAALADARLLAGAAAKLDASRIDELVRQNQDIISKDLMDSLNHSSRALKETDDADRAAGLSTAEKPIESGPLKYKAAPGEVDNKYTQQHKKLLGEADKAVARLTGASAGGANVSTHMEANRVQAILLYAKGRIERNRAGFEAWQSAQYRDTAQELVDSVAALQRNARSVAARVPDESITELAGQIEREQQEIGRLNNEIGAIAKAVSEGQAMINEQEEHAAAARRRMIELETSGAPIHEENGEYASLSRAARAAEAAADNMRNGTLSDATTIAPPLGGDLIETRYEDGRQIVGVRDLAHFLELRREQLAGREALLATLQQRRADAIRMRDEMKSRARAASTASDEQLIVIDELLSKAENHHRNADQAAENAIKFFAQAVQAANKASTAATTRVNEARTAQADATEPERERLQMIIDDADMKASIDTIVAECAHSAAMTRADQLDWIRSHHIAQLGIAARVGRDMPADIDAKIDDLRDKAKTEAAKAVKSYEGVSKELARAKSRVDGVVVQGKDYKWQADLGQAASHLLLAALTREPDERKSEQDAAYAILREVIQGKEQSPAMQPAIQALLTLQETAR